MCYYLGGERVEVHDGGVGGLNVSGIEMRVMRLSFDFLNLLLLFLSFLQLFLIDRCVDTGQTTLFMVPGDETMASDNKHPFVGAIGGGRLSITGMERHDRLAAGSREGRSVHD